MVDDKIPEITEYCIDCMDYERALEILVQYSNILLFYGAMLIVFLMIVIASLSWALVVKNKEK